VREELNIEYLESFFKDLESVFNKFPKYHMKNVLGDFNSKVGREDITNNWK
jgi:hypothetical protein